MADDLRDRENLPVTRNARAAHRGASTRRTTRQRGGIDELSLGALRMRVDAGVDPISKGRLFLTEVVRPERARGSG